MRRPDPQHHQPLDHDGKTAAKKFTNHIPQTAVADGKRTNFLRFAPPAEVAVDLVVRVDVGGTDDGAVDEDEQDPDAVVREEGLGDLNEAEDDNRALQCGPDPELRERISGGQCRGYKLRNAVGQVWEEVSNFCKSFKRLKVTYSLFGTAVHPSAPS